MEFKYPVAQADGKEYTAEELYGLLADEDSGYYLLSANRLWHGGVHFTNKKFPQCVNDVSIRAIADGKVVAYRLNDVHEYVEQTVSPAGEALREPIKHRYSTGFCLIKHEYEIKKSEAQKKQEADAKKQQETQQRVQQTASQLNGQQITIKGGSRNRYSVTDGKVGVKNGTYAAGTKLDIISVNQTLHGDYYYAKVRQENTTEEFFIALLDKEGNPLKSGGNPFFDMPQAATPNTPTQPATAQATNNNQPSNTDGNKAKKNTDSYKLTFYSLYMHLSAYEDYLPKKGEKKQVQKQTFTIKATDLNVREKFRGEGGQAIGYISDGATIEAEINADTLKTTGNITDLKATIKSGSVTKGSNTVKQVGDVIWVPIRSGNNRYIVEALPQLPTPPKEKTRPNYWQGTVTAGVSSASKDQQNASGLEIYASKADLEKRINRIAVLNANASNKFTYESDKVELIKSTDGKPSVLLAECKPAAGAQFSYAKGEPVAMPSVFWTTVDTSKSIIIEKLEPKQFNSVVKCNIDIKAGDALGYMGLYETPTQTGEQKSKRQVHVEVFIGDGKDVNFLLNNPLKLTDGKQYIRLPKGTGLFDKPVPQSPATADATGAQPATTTPQASPAASYTLTRDHVFALGKITLEKDPDGKEWYVIAAEKHSGRVQKTATRPEVVNQHEWTKLGFQKVQETNSNSDGYLDLDKMPQIFKDIHTQIDTNKNGKIEESELQAALKDSDLREQWCKFIAYHPTEWRVDTSPLIACFAKILISPLITGARLLFGQSLLDQETKRMLKLSFWEKVGHANSTEVYHFHPVAFIEHISQSQGIGWARSPFAELLGRVESKNDYSAYNRTTPSLRSFYNTNLTTLTIKQVQDKQAARDMFATGRFQVIPDTLTAAVKSLKLGTSLKYDMTTQDKIFEEYLIKVKRPQIINYLEGDGSVEDAIYAWAKEFASAGVRKGKPISKGRVAAFEGSSYYQGDGLNSAHIMPDEMVRVLEESKANAHIYRRTGQDTNSTDVNNQDTELSGRAWVARFPNSNSTADLNSPFRENVNSFISALRAAGATVTISSTYRPPERAYLMHWSYNIATRGQDPRTVPAREGVNINWVHMDEQGNYSSTKSVQAARDMVNGYNIAFQPSLTTNHAGRTAIDMTITWSGTLNIVNAQGTTVAITSTPRTGAGNTDLHTVGRSYSVLKLVSDAPHWSANGR